MRKHLIAEDSIGNLRCIHEIHLQQSSLQMSLFRVIVLERLQQEARSLLRHVLTREDVRDPLEVDERSTLVLVQHSSELSTLFRVLTRDVLQERGIVWSEADSLRIDDDFAELPSLSEAGNDLVGNVCSKVDRQS